MKYISPGGWFSLEYPMGWHEFEDTEESFLFYNPDRWTGDRKSTRLNSSHSTSSRMPSSA